MSDETRFSFKDLDLCQKAVEFADGVIDVSENLDSDRRHFRLIEQTESAVTSIAMNIAEGKGRYSNNEFKPPAASCGECLAACLPVNPGGQALAMHVHPIFIYRKGITF